MKEIKSIMIWNENPQNKLKQKIQEAAKPLTLTQHLFEDREVSGLGVTVI